MSIQLTVPPRTRSYRSYADPSLPDGYWGVHASVLGDASGGLQSVNIRFSTATEPNPSTLWNLEQLLCAATANPLEVRVDFGNMDIELQAEESTGAFQKVYHIDLADLGVAATGRAMGLSVMAALPIFLGAARKEVNADLAFDTDNNDGSSFSIMAQGYFWGPGAINAPGGPQRPVTGLYGR